MKPILEKYAKLLLDYCLELQSGQRLFINTTTLAQPLVREIYRHAVHKGVHVHHQMRFREQERIFFKHAHKHQLEYVSPFFAKAVEEFDAYLYIRAPFNLSDNLKLPQEKTSIRSKAMSNVNQIYFKRTSTRDLKRNLCQYPTQASAQIAGMSLEEYQEFIFSACELYKDDPIQAWLNRGKDQQIITDFLNSKSHIRYTSSKFDISFSTLDRTWINSDGQTNMPSGEVYTSPVEDSVNGTIYFSYPSIHQGNMLRDIQLTVKDGYIIKWTASQGKEYLDQIFKIEGTRRFGEAAIGTNYGISKITNNILFDEKIGGSIHMAIGQSYQQSGGKNQSSIHWDMITDMTQDGKIYADGELCYENGNFTI